jgi:hypothetical protein
MDMLDGITQFINQTGFPIFVAVYVLARLEKVVKDNTSAMKAILEQSKELQSKSTAVKETT